ncbi:MAG: hypothetical protein ACYTGX_07085 [Planctomycetota bacterium]
MAGTPTWWDGFVRDVLKRWPNTELGQVDEMPALFVNGNPFVALSSFDILVRVDEFTRNRALAKPMAREIEPDDGFNLPRGWVLLTVPSSAAERFSEEWSRPAYEFVAAMAPKRRLKTDDDDKKSSRKKAAKSSRSKKAKSSKKKPASKKKKAPAKKAKKKSAKKKPAKRK